MLCQVWAAAPRFRCWDGDVAQNAVPEKACEALGTFFYDITSAFVVLHAQVCLQTK